MKCKSSWRELSMRNFMIIVAVFLVGCAGMAGFQAGTGELNVHWGGWYHVRMVFTGEPQVTPLSQWSRAPSVQGQDGLKDIWTIRILGRSFTVCRKANNPRVRKWSKNKFP